MNMQTAILIVVSMWAGLGLWTIWLLWWFNKNSVSVQITKDQEGVFLSSGGRYRLIKNKLYKINDFFRRKPLIINFDDDKSLQDFFIVTEGIPIIGIKKTLKLIETFDEYKVPILKAWYPFFDEDIEPTIESSDVAFTEATRKELYESTKLEMSKAEVMQKIILPMGMLVLAIACLIFFPKIYAAIKESGNVAINTAISRFSETISRFAPLG